jgi:hypothetical protein
MELELLHVSDDDESGRADLFGAAVKLWRTVSI